MMFWRCNNLVGIPRVRGFCYNLNKFYSRTLYQLPLVNSFRVYQSKSLIFKILNCTCHNQSHSDNWKDDLKKDIEHLNHLLMNHPKTSLGTFLCIRNGSWWILFALCNYLGIGSTSLGFGYLVAKFTAKFRASANIAVAVMLQKAFPMLSEIQGATLLGKGVFPELEKQENKEPTEFDKKIQKMNDYLTAPIDKYGFAYYLAGKINIFITITTTAALLHFGIDIKTVLDGLGVPAAIQDGGGAMAFATLINTFLIPPHLIILTYLVPLTSSYLNIYDIITKQKK